MRRSSGARPAGTLTGSMERKSITTSRAAVACDVCGRTLLRGEHADAFIANGSRRMVCELCTARAANEGWIREGADNALGVRRNGPRNGRSLLGRLKPPRRAAPPPVELPYRRISANVDRIVPGTQVTTPVEHDEHVDRRRRPAARDRRRSSPRRPGIARAAPRPRRARRTPT